GADAPALHTFREAIAIVESVRARLEPSLKAEFLANKRDVYDAAIDLILQDPNRNSEQLFGLFEQARSRNLQDALRTTTGIPTLRAVQSRLAVGSLLIEYWTGADRVAALWATKDSSGVVTR